jgi:hypothetical protein
MIYIYSSTHRKTNKYNKEQAIKISFSFYIVLGYKGTKYKENAEKICRINKFLYFCSPNFRGKTILKATKLLIKS